MADLDYLSGGRVDFGVGIGWLKEEFENLGMISDSRAARTEEYLLAMKALWSDGVAEFSGETVTLKPRHFNLASSAPSPACHLWRRIGRSNASGSSFG